MGLEVGSKSAVTLCDSALSKTSAATAGGLHLLPLDSVGALFSFYTHRHKSLKFGATREGTRYSKNCHLHCQCIAVSLCENNSKGKGRIMNK